MGLRNFFPSASIGPRAQTLLRRASRVTSMSEYDENIRIRGGCTGRVIAVVLVLAAVIIILAIFLVQSMFTQQPTIPPPKVG